MRPSLLFVPAIAAATHTISLHAQIVSYGLDGSVHPADAGWTYFVVGNSVTGEEAFQLGRGTIEQRTMGIGYTGQGANYYYLPVTVDHASSWTLDVRMRVMASEQWSFPFGAFVEFGNTGAALMADSVSPFAGIWVTYPFDGTQWHDYRWEVTPCGHWTMFVDGEYFTSGAFAQTEGTLWLAFGDGTGGSNADASYDSIVAHVNFGSGADFNGDGVVDAGDLAVLLGAWAAPGLTDLDCSGTTDAGDIAILLGQWG